MQKLVIQTQYLENYGSPENPYMKFKGGSTYVMHNCGDIEPRSNLSLIHISEPTRP